MRKILEFNEFFEKEELWHYIPIEIEVLDYLFSSIDNISEYNFIELGSGEGRNCFYAANFFNKVYGVEIYEEYYNISIEIQNNKKPIKLHLPGDHETISRNYSREVDKGILNNNVKFILGDITNKSIVNQFPKTKSLVFTYQPYQKAIAQHSSEPTVKEKYNQLIKLYYDHLPKDSIFYFHDCYLNSSNYKGLNVKKFDPMYDKNSLDMNCIIKL